MSQNEEFPPALLVAAERIYYALGPEETTMGSIFGPLDDRNRWSASGRKALS